MSPNPPEFISADVLAYRHRRARHQRHARLTVVLAALCTALLPAAAPHASAATHKDLFGNRLYVVNSGSGTVSVIDT
ncbi:MAG: PQQ-dependent protein, partial [Streptomyces oryziradicis]|nr:PQQ-dependent protein [Actinacidiphila oryziradicis]